MSIIYQIYPRSYQDDNADGVGDLRGITRRLPHIADLGAEFVWISPFFKSPMKDFGYDVSDYYSVDPVFGTNEDFDVLLKKADSLGLKIMVDLVLSHASEEHPWFQESRQSRDNPKADWYVWADPKPDGTPPNNWNSVFGGSAWQWEPLRQQYYLHHFLVEQPALNAYCDAVVEEHLSIMRHWLDKGVRGFRLDAIHHLHHDPMLRDNPPRLNALKNRVKDTYEYQDYKYSLAQPAADGYLQKLRQVANGYDGALLLGEVIYRDMARRFTGPDKLHNTYFFDIIMKRDHDGAGFRRSVEEVLKDFPDNAFYWALSNHDVLRHVTRMQPEAKHVNDFAKMIAAFFMALPGGYCLYQGEELGLPSPYLTRDQIVDPYDKRMFPYHMRRDDARTPMPWEMSKKNAGFSGSDKTWLPVADTHYDFAVDTQRGVDGSVYEFYKTLIAWRKKHELECKTATFLDAPEPVQAFQNGVGGVFYFNFSAQSVTVNVDADCIALNAISQSAALQGQELHLKPYGFAFFTKA